MLGYGILLLFPSCLVASFAAMVLYCDIGRAEGCLSLASLQLPCTRRRWPCHFPQHLTLENDGEGDFDGEGGIGVAGAGGLARHTSLPGRGKSSYDHHVETDLGETKEAMAFSLAEPEPPLA